MNEAALIEPSIAQPIRIDLGCGKNKREGFTGVDIRSFDGKVDVVCDLGHDPWPWPNDSVEEAHASHFVEHLKPMERVHFANELHRVLKKGAKCTLIVPHWSSPRAYGDVTHEWPPVTEFWFPYLNAAWRKDNAPHNDFYVCDFDSMQPGYSMNPAIQLRSQEFQQFALTHYRTAADDMITTIIKR